MFLRAIKCSNRCFLRTVFRGVSSGTRAARLIPKTPKSLTSTSRSCATAKHLSPITATPKDQLREIVFDAIKIHTGSVQFGTIFSTVTSRLRTRAGAFVTPVYTTYTGGLDDGDVASIREIVWDLIILRYLTPGDYPHDCWPHLSLTEKDKAFFAA